MEEFRGLDRDVEGSAKQWRKWAESECPEKEKLPQEWKKESLIQKLIILRAMRPDRMAYALRWGQLALIETKLEETLSQRLEVSGGDSMVETLWFVLMKSDSASIFIL